MSIGEGIGQGLMFLAQNISANKRADKEQKRAIELFNLKKQAELEADQKQQEQELALLNPLKIQKGTKREKREIGTKDIFNFTNPNTGEVTPLTRAQAEERLALINANQDQITPTMLSQRDALGGFLASNPQYEEVETPEYYNPQELLAYKKLGILGELMKNQNSDADRAQSLAQIEKDPTLSKEQKSALKASIYAGKGGASLGREFYVNPYEQSRITYTDRRTQDIGEDNTRADSKFAWQQQYQGGNLEEKKRHNQVTEGQGAQRIGNQFIPTYSTTSYDAQGNSTTVRQKGASPQASKKSSKASILAAIQRLN